MTHILFYLGCLLTSIDKTQNHNELDELILMRKNRLGGTLNRHSFIIWHIWSPFIYTFMGLCMFVGMQMNDRCKELWYLSKTSELYERL